MAGRGLGCVGQSLGLAGDGTAWFVVLIADGTVTPADFQSTTEYYRR